MAEVEGAEAVGLVFRIAALALSVAAAVVMGTASQLVVVDGGRGPSSYVVSYSHYSALVYFVVAGVVSAICSAVALYLSAVHNKPAGAFCGRVTTVAAVRASAAVAVAVAALAAKDARQSWGGCCGRARARRREGRG
ncbi:CASP-like protein 1U1 [Phragmites australis]|uniref:CASP-like protein 1U1 n=1 Tax=Phragmites australis TaxID=29695 RepID=UPI002D77036C|nr:CASP-like protein 1U1 [Phragmites australis]